MTLAPFDLRGELVHLQPMALDHVDELVAAGTVDRSTYGFTELPADRASMTAHVSQPRCQAAHAHARLRNLGRATVDLETDARNARSRAAIERLGAKLDGVIRNWQQSLVPGEEGRPRDSALHSIIPSEWPAIRDRLRRGAPEAPA